MEQTLRIAIIGDYNFAYHSHNATNLALQHAEEMLEISINYYWLNERECCEENLDYVNEYDGVLIAPGPYTQPFYFQSIINRLLEKNIPVLGTGDCFKILVETYFSKAGFDLRQEKVISENLIEGNYFTNITLDNLTQTFAKLYSTKSNQEYSSSRYSMLPQYNEILAAKFEIAARNQYFDPEILALKEHEFFVFTMFCPQIVSTRDLPHPLIIQFIKQAIRYQGKPSELVSKKS